MTPTPPAFPPTFAWKPLAGRALELALDRLLALDSDTRDALAGLDGRRITLSVEAPPLALAITVRGGRLVVGPVRETDGEADLAVRATLGALLSRLAPRPGGAGDGGQTRHRVRIAGDAELARRLQRLAGNFDPDWALPFARVFGDVLGHRIARVVQGALRAGADAAGTLARDGAEYLTEESRDVVGRAELAAFNDDVDALRERADRLLARVARLPSAPAAEGGA